jgi:hypothetical protein
MFKFSLYQAVHKDPDQSPGGGPARGGQVGLAGAGQDETAGRRPLIDSPLDRAEYLWYYLPFIHQQREGAICQRGIRIRAYNCGFGGTVQPEPLLTMSSAGGRLSARARTHDEDGRVVR